MAFYRIRPDCGAYLDPGEQCSCHEECLIEMERKEKASLSSDNYYEFSKEDLLRDNWSRKPAYGKVDPTVVGESMKPYVCQVDQMIMGIDQIRQTDLSRRQGPTTMQPKQQRVKTIDGTARKHRVVLKKKMMKIIMNESMQNSKIRSSM